MLHTYIVSEPWYIIIIMINVCQQSWAHSKQTTKTSKYDGYEKRLILRIKTYILFVLFGGQTWCDLLSFAILYELTVGIIMVCVHLKHEHAVYYYYMNHWLQRLGWRVGVKSIAWICWYCYYQHSIHVYTATFESYSQCVTVTALSSSRWGTLPKLYLKTR